MSRTLRTLFRAAGILLGIALLLIGGFISWLSMNEFLPRGKVAIAVGGRAPGPLPAGKVFTLLTWNIGYGGLGKGMDFFYDGGSHVRPGRDESARCLSGINHLLAANDSADFILLQEIDAGSKRSWYTDQVSAVSAALNGYCHAWAPNYDVPYVPVPVNDPMGRVLSGIAAWSRFHPDSTTAIYFPRLVGWPKRVVYLKRCCLLMRCHLDSGKDLVVINTHNSAFDSSGLMRKDELRVLDTLMQEEYSKGNYVVAGGDWNDNPRGFNPSAITSGDYVIRAVPPAYSQFVPGWQFVFDPSEPTNRNVDIAYVRGLTHTTIIDFFVVSPNVEVLGVKTIPTGFSFSDHQPVVVKLRLRWDRGDR